MNLLFLSQVFPDDDAPVRGTFNRALCRALAEQHSVRVVSPRPWTEALPRRLRGHGDYRSQQSLNGTGVTAAYPTFWYLPRVRLDRSGTAMTRSITRCVDQLTRDWTPDAILSYWAHPEGRTGIDLGRRFHVPTACIIGGSDVLLLPKQNARRRAEIVRVIQESDRLFTVSHGLRQACLDLGASPDKVHTVYQGIDSDLFSPGDQVEARRQLRLSESLPTFVWVGRMVDVKGLDVLLDAVRQLHRTGYRFRLHLLGDGPLRKSLEQRAVDNSIQNVVDFRGPVASRDLAVWYRAADATLLSSRSEGLPNVLRESLACGTPFVSTDVGSIREIADPSYSILVPSGDPAAFATALRSIIHPDYRLGAACYQPRTWADCANEITTLMSTPSSHRFATSDLLVSHS